jgi:hypothetical protein
MDGHGPRRWITSALSGPLIVSAVDDFPAAASSA